MENQMIARQAIANEPVIGGETPPSHPPVTNRPAHPGLNPVELASRMAPPQQPQPQFQQQQQPIPPQQNYSVPSSMKELMNASKEQIEAESLASKLDMLNKKIEKMGESKKSDDDDVDVKSLVQSEFSDPADEDNETLNKITNILAKNNQKLKNSINKKIEKVADSNQHDFNNDLNRAIPNWDQLSNQDPNFAVWLQQNPDSLNAIKSGIEGKNTDVVKSVVSHYHQSHAQQPQPNVHQGMPSTPYVSRPPIPQSQAVDPLNPSIVPSEQFQRFVEAVNKSPHDPAIRKMSQAEFNSFMKSNTAFHVGRTITPFPVSRS